MKKNPPPEWALDADVRLKRLCMSKTQLAELLDINYTMMCNTMTGYLANKPDIQNLILSKLDELEMERSVLNV